VISRDQVPGRLRALLGALREAYRPERLPPPPPSGPVHAGPGLLARLFTREPLDQVAPPAPTARRGVVSLLFAAEPLEQATASPAPRGGSWLTWLFGRERLDP
jgi:hypothetical protein